MVALHQSAQPVWSFLVFSNSKIADSFFVLTFNGKFLVRCNLNLRLLVTVMQPFKKLPKRLLKAQRAKIESLKYGQTSLHVFSAPIDFSCKTARTSFGSVGVKVWICYQENLDTHSF